MTRPEPAGVGTAEMIAAEIIASWSDHWMHCVTRDEREPLIDAFASAITAAESRAMERCAKIAEDYDSASGASDEIAKLIREAK